MTDHGGAASPRTDAGKCPDCDHTAIHACGACPDCPQWHRAAQEAPAPEGLRQALEAFGARLAAEGYGWEAIITREGPNGEETVAHLTTANPDPAYHTEAFGPSPDTRHLPDRAEARPPEGLDAALKHLWAIRSQAKDGIIAVDAGALDPAIDALAARLSAGGATKP